MDSAYIFQCLLCGARSASYWFTRKGLDSQPYQVMRCHTCDGGFVHPPPSENYLQSFYSSTMNSHGGALDVSDVVKACEQVVRKEQEYPNSTVDARRLIGQARRLARGNRFLDIGAGFGFFTREAQDAGFDCTAIEVGESSSAVFERLNGFAPKRRHFNESFSHQHAGAFDVVLMSQVLEHIPHPRETAKQLARVLAPGGICVIAVPHFGSYVSRLQGRRDMFITPPEHVNYFSMRGLLSTFHGSFECTDAYTVSRYDRLKLRRKLGPAGDAAYSVLSSFLRFSDKKDRGMFINAIFRKSSA